MATRAKKAAVKKAVTKKSIQGDLPKGEKIVRYLIIGDENEPDSRIVVCGPSMVQKGIQKFVDGCYGYGCGCDTESLAVIAIYSNGAVRSFGVDYGPYIKDFTPRNVKEVSDD